MKRLLLDTQAFLWLHTDPARLGGARELLELNSTELLLSPASSWEIAIKWRLGKLPLPEPPEAYIPERMRRAKIHSLPVTHAHTLGVSGLPDHHRDPFDRLLVAQATVEGVPIVTSDRLIRQYEVDVVWIGAS